MSAALGEIACETAFQPIVALDDERIVGYEALCRWPDATGVAPDEVFASAEKVGTTAELDQRCIRGAARSALAAPLPSNAMLLINIEPGTEPAMTANDGSLAAACERFKVVLELTERHLLDHPGPLLANIAELRASGVRIALDDVGSDPDVLAWLDVIDPDVIKLDLSLIQHRPAPEQARVLNAVYCPHERTGAAILAEGIETDAHLEQARAVGATFGQGYRFGRPVTFGENDVGCGEVEPPAALPAPRSPTVVGSPFDLVDANRNARTGPQHLLAAFSRDIQRYAAHAIDRPMVLATIPWPDRMPDSALRRYRQLAQSCSLVAVFGCDLPADVGAGIVGIPLASDDSLCSQWALIALGSHTAFALIAREHPDTAAVPYGDRPFTFAMTTDRSRVAAAAASLLSRIP